MSALREALTAHHVPFKVQGQHHHATPNRVQLDCYLCSPDSGKFRLGIHERTKKANCWICGKVSTYQALVGLLGREEARRLCKPDQHYHQEVTTPVSGIFCQPAGVGDLQPVHLRYLKGRGFDPKQLTELWGVRGIGIHPQLSWRLYLPIVYQGRPVSYTTRAIVDGDGSRYITARPDEEQIPAKHVLLGLDYVKHAVIVHEGPMDVYRIGPGATATLGISYTLNQLLILKEFPVRVVCFDSEPRAQQRARNLCEDLACFPGETLLVELDAKDPGSASECEIKRLRRLLD